MTKFHIKENGNPGPCKAQEGNCPFGQDAPHFSTAEDARTHYEHLNTALATAAQKTQTFDRTQKYITPNSKELTDTSNFALAEEGMIALQDDVVDTGYASSYDGIRNVVEKFKRPYFEMEVITEAFKPDGSHAHADERYSAAGIYDERDQALLWDAMKRGMDKETHEELTANHTATRHQWTADNVLITYRMFLQA